jgi:soluble lytic murein transglycosylase-like protein
MTPVRETTRRLPDSRLTRRLVRAAVTVATAAVMVTGGLTGVPASAHDRDLPSGRKVVPYTVKPGDTATGLAVRFHAWTAELISHNHLGRSARMTVGQRLRIPVVVAAARADRREAKRDRKDRTRKAQARKARTRKAQARKKAARSRSAREWKYADPSRRTVRRVITRTASRHGVDPRLALAVSWQEAGWQMHHVSSANAIGAMQVLPTTGTWMSLYAGRPLRLTRTRDNVLAGVLLLDVLADHTRSRRRQIAAYYQGLGAVRENGLYDETKRYVANVQVIKRRLERGLPPAP